MKTLHKILFIILGVVVGVGILGFANGVLGTITDDLVSSEAGRFKSYEFFASTTPSGGTLQATTTSATSTNIIPSFDSNGRYDSGYFVIAGAKKVSFFFGRGDTLGNGNSGSSVFSVEVSPNGTDWYGWKRLNQNVATSTNEWQVENISVAAGTSTTLTGMDIRNHSPYAVRCIVVETTDGEHRCRATANW